MPETRVANIRDGWVEGGVYIGRARDGLDGYFGNPVVKAWMMDRDQVIALFRQAFETRIQG